MAFRDSSRAASTQPVRAAQPAGSGHPEPAALPARAAASGASKSALGAELAGAAAAPNSPEIAWARVQMAPSLPMTVFTSTQRWESERVGALAIYCSDGRWGSAFDEFCHRSLNIPRYDRFAVPGGPAWINQIDSDLPDLYRAAHGQLEYLVRSHELDRIVLITHYGCGFYHERHHLDAEACLPLQSQDVAKAAQTLQQWFKGVAVESYLAMRQGDMLSFHQLKA